MDEKNDNEVAWERLCHYGINTISWSPGHDIESNLRRLDFRFKDADDKTVLVEVWLSFHQDESRYFTSAIPPELEERGIENVWVTTTTVPHAIHIKMKGQPEVITLTDY
jgi:hypothetical protein